MAARGSSRETARGAHLLPRLLAALCMVVGTCLVTGAPALAIGQRGHVFAFAFGEAGQGEGQFSEPVAVGVSALTGDVYVADRKNKQIERFKPVLDGSGEPTGEEFVDAWSVTKPSAIAVDSSGEESDPSKGDVYVVGGSGKTIYKFTAEGNRIAEIKKVKEAGGNQRLEPIEAITVDGHGNLYVYEENHVVRKLDNALSNQGAGSVLAPFKAAAKRGLAVDSEGDLYVANQTESASGRERQDEEELLELPIIAKLEGSTGNVLVAEIEGEATNAVAASPSDHSVFLLNEAHIGGVPHSTVAAFTEGGSLIQRIGAPGLQEGGAIAADPANGSLYVLDTASKRVDVFTLEGEGPPTVEGLSSQTLPPSAPATNATKLIAQVNPRGADTHYRFEYGSESCASSSCTVSEPADVGSGFGDREVGLELQSLPPGLYFYRVIAENTHGTVTSDEQTLPILTLFTSLPDGRAFEMVSPPQKGGTEPEPFTRRGGWIASSENGRAMTYVANGPMPAGQQPEGNRSPEDTQILSTRGPGGWSSQDIITPNAAGTGVPIGEAPEYQSFSDTLALAVVQPFPGNSHSGKFEGPPLAPADFTGEAREEKTIYLRTNRATSAEETEQDLPLRDSERESSELAADNGAEMDNPGFLPLVSKLNAPGGEEFGGGAQEGLIFLGATSDLAHVVFASYSASPGLYEWSGAKQQLELVSALPDGTQLPPVENAATLGGTGGIHAIHAISDDGSRVFWTSNRFGTLHLYVHDAVTHKSLQLDSVQPETKDVGSPQAVFQTASADGSRVFFTDTERLTPDSKAGSGGKPDLYVAELRRPSAGAPLIETLKDLTPEGPFGGGGQVLAPGASTGVLGASEDGSYVYFVANGALTPDAQRGNCPAGQQQATAGSTCNLYMRRAIGTEWQPTKLVTVLSSEDRPDWGGGGGAGVGDPVNQTSRVSPSGEYLTFMSMRSLTGYDNEDVSSKAPGERLDEEVFLYNAPRERLVCVSCNPTGARPTGVFDRGTDLSGGADESNGLVVDEPLTWAKGGAKDPWLAANIPGFTAISSTTAVYQSRLLSDAGRVFFNSADALVPLAQPTRSESVEGALQQVGLMNVYEYEPDGVGGCHAAGGCVGLISPGTSERESVFLDASASGEDVFFLTAEQIGPQDHDTNFDVYDARVCEPSHSCPPPPPPAHEECADEACQGTYTPPSGFGAPETSTFSGPGNVLHLLSNVLGASTEEQPKPKPKPLTRSQKLAKALKACRKLKSRHKRVACEKQARKRYGAVKKAKKRASGGHR
ncbi:MAG TPA: NHL repeat-containing protein [Solirubrobacteraceae bacterium]|nr:NHL repeat-containing protein [Solirubrobacteraceae bacterium]